ncbi:hypothetical protein P692DRAFT_20874995 [Suillus brevipes Sb2]|nr:hypothetical protein P692DRAFT_20874995 [Suillus brevipes Sb2]
MKPFGAVVERASKGRVIWALWMDSVMREDTTPSAHVSAQILPSMLAHYILEFHLWDLWHSRSLIGTSASIHPALTLHRNHEGCLGPWHQHHQYCQHLLKRQPRCQVHQKGVFLVDASLARLDTWSEQIRMSLPHPLLTPSWKLQGQHKSLGHSRHTQCNHMQQRAPAVSSKLVTNLPGVGLASAYATPDPLRALTSHVLLSESA